MPVYDLESEHERHTLAEWRKCIMQGLTVLGYNDFVLESIASDG